MSTRLTKVFHRTHPRAVNAPHQLQAHLREEWMSGRLHRRAQRRSLASAGGDKIRDEIRRNVYKRIDGFLGGGVPGRVYDAYQRIGIL